MSERSNDKKLGGFCPFVFWGGFWHNAESLVEENTHTHLHTHAPQRCLFTITTPLTRGNNAECVKVLHSERRTKPIFVSQLALPPDWAAPLWETSHRKTQPSPHTTGHINVQMYARNFQKSQNYWAKWGSCTQIVGIMNNYCTFSGTFLIFFPFWQKQWLQWFNWGKSKRGVKLLCFRGSV